MEMTRGEPIGPPVAANRFGALLRQYRVAIGLTQESLAQRAGLSVHGIHKLEVGVTHTYRDTARLGHFLLSLLNKQEFDDALIQP
jgi:transcriptional regulator with XRE-family HTH domain